MILDLFLYSSKGTEAMRTNVARCMSIVLTTVVLSGCYSGGQWAMPWKSSPFQSSTPIASPGTVSAGEAVGNRGGWQGQQPEHADDEPCFDRPRRDHSANDVHGNADRLRCVWHCLPSGAVSLCHDKRRHVQFTVRLRAGLRGKHGRCARRERIRHSAPRFCGCEQALRFRERCPRLVLRKCESGQFAGVLV